ncbi:MAG: TonB-dependent receptor [Candidatus Marinimicrobia bacterium]|jgi:outer membrane receptor protein involved in Fe transport|nr:TonB-dependent receptor [Candidatus Neomarinimicrobiota bacterium]MBT3630796.1 TonB-dependent receptor [Candidatus Neomarinimicrobiota bacterium]MBT3825598.1 TonB-dependent receptor [Candidatus Neomarinimicrobiota bacterium]MBT4131182.1 TonB-dependent receptor [Candidatus Neomarinimicrobiota bacterium]MBT4296358.1 TonB-dependent receptor [Candidatus Neomarinimicrobiota bacterium]
MNKLFTALIFSLLIVSSMHAQTTGKIAGKIRDAENKEFMIGVNVIIEEAGVGAVTDEHGYYDIINLTPGTYTVKVSMIGYEIYVVEDVRVSTNRTTYLDADINSSIMEGATVVVTASKISTKRDQTSTVKNISSEDIEVLPVESIGAVVNMQAGVVAGHFRGGRSGEVSYLIDGIQVDEVFGGNSATVSVETEAVQDLEVITGTFNAEYGNAMSGIVNAVTKNGSKEFHASVSSSIATYFTSNTYEGEKDIFLGLEPFGLTGNKEDRFNLNTNYDNKFMITGPILGDRIGFFINYREQSTAGHLNGIRRFNVWDVSDYSSADSLEWDDVHTGDSAFVSMGSSKHSSLLTKLSFKPSPKLRSSIMFNRNVDEWSGYSHANKYKPDGRNKNYGNTDFIAFQLNHMLSNSLFYDIKLSQSTNYYGNYLFKDPQSYTIAEEFSQINGIWYAAGDTVYNYIHELYANSFGPGFSYGGQDKGHTERETITKNAKFDLTWQVNNTHSLKTGVQLSQHDITSSYHLIKNAYAGTDNEYDYKPVTLGNNTLDADSYTKKPIDGSFYIQDKMEFDEMVINVGLRYDYFDANTVYPSQRRNPSNSSTYYVKDSLGVPILVWDSELQDSVKVLDEPRMSEFLDSKSIYQISPRFGLAYQLGNRAVLHFSYGHFFQMPAYSAIYANDAFLVGSADYGTTMGNGNLGGETLGLNAQKTVSYEIGLWQELAEGMGVEVNLYYRDIYDLLTVAVVTTYNQINYGLYTNKDYGNVRGLEVKFDFNKGGFRTNVNYTLQYTKGNADNPQQTFNRAGSKIDEVNKMIPMSWDQRHTFNVSAGYTASNYGGFFTGYVNSGTTYSYSPMTGSPLVNINLAPNNNYKALGYHVDFTGFLRLPQMFGVNARLNLSVYNVLDRYNENYVNSTTGRAYSDIVEEGDIEGHRSKFNTYDDRYKDPGMFSTPREIKIGLEVEL